MPELQIPLYDLGTPRPSSTNVQVSLEIDGQQIKVDEGTSVMRAAALLGIDVPKLCATDQLDAFGSCRITGWTFSIHTSTSRMSHWAMVH